MAANDPIALKQPIRDTKCHSLGFADLANVYISANLPKNKPRPRYTLYMVRVEQNDTLKGGLYWASGPDLGRDFMGSLKLGKKCQVYSCWRFNVVRDKKFPYTM